jgi:prophage tail gpP-like protein
VTVALLVNGRRYDGWRSVAVTRTIQAASGTFALEISDKWTGQSLSWPIVEEDECTVELNGEPVITGWVDTRSQAIGPSTRTFAVNGKDKAAALVENSALLDRYSYKQTTALEVARAVAAPFGVTVRVGGGIELPRLRKIAINPGETAFEVVQRVAEASGLIVVSDGVGAMILTQAGESRADAIIEGRNVLNASITYNAAERFASYVVLGQRPGDNNSTASGLRARGEAIDSDVRRSDRVQVIRPQRAVTRAEARRLADWTARNRAATAEEVTVGVQGWEQSSGAVWPVNALTAVRIESLGIDGDMLIAGASHSLSSRGETTALTLVRPDAYEPNPAGIVAAADWKQERGAGVA